MAKNTKRIRAIEKVLSKSISEHPEQDAILRKGPHVSKEIKFTRGFGEGGFHCSKGHSWFSHRAIVTFDMGAKSVSKIWKQACSSCKSFHEPRYTALQIEEICNNAIEHFLKKLKDPEEHHSRKEGSGGPPHRSDLCEACKKNKCVHSKDTKNIGKSHGTMTKSASGVDDLSGNLMSLSSLRDMLTSLTIR